MSAKLKRKSWPQRFRHFLLRDGGTGLLLVAFLIFGTEVRHITELFYFPPQDKPIATYLIWTIAIVSWKVTRLIIHARKEASGKGKGYNHLKKRLVWSAVTAILIGVAAVGAYRGLSTNYVSTPTPDEKTSKEMTAKVFFHPLFPSKEFSDSLRVRGGYSVVVDNDAEWLEDNLANETSVIGSKVMILGSVLIAVAGFIVGTTALSSLPVPPISVRDITEEGATEMASKV